MSAYEADVIDRYTTPQSVQGDGVLRARHVHEVSPFSSFCQERFSQRLRLRLMKTR